MTKQFFMTVFLALSLAAGLSSCAHRNHHHQKCDKSAKQCKAKKEGCKKCSKKKCDKKKCSKKKHGKTKAETEGNSQESAPKAE